MALNSFIRERGTAMPQLRKLGPEEVKALENKGKGQRRLTEEQYDAFLSEYDVGDYGEAELEADEKRLTVRNRLKAAAKRREAGIEFRRTQGSIIRFHVIAFTDGAAKATPRAASAKAKAPP